MWLRWNDGDVVLSMVLFRGMDVREGKGGVRFLFLLFQLDPSEVVLFIHLVGVI